MNLWEGFNKIQFSYTALILRSEKNWRLHTACRPHHQQCTLKLPPALPRIGSACKLTRQLLFSLRCLSYHLFSLLSAGSWRSTFPSSTTRPRCAAQHTVQILFSPKSQQRSSEWCSSTKLVQFSSSKCAVLCFFPLRNKFRFFLQ